MTVTGERVRHFKETEGGLVLENTFCEVKLFQVKPDKLEEFEKLIAVVAEEQKQQKGCIDIKYLNC